jgi:hypothetical protein
LTPLGTLVAASKRFPLGSVEQWSADWPA